MNYDRLMTQISEELFVLQSYDRNTTDFISITKKGEKLKVRLKLRIEKKLSLVLKQEERILCNGRVYYANHLS